jgi:D-arabinose 1-dehydrogenase-like Zn-dependent alcohol dehydrogenase
MPDPAQLVLRNLDSCMKAVRFLGQDDLRLDEMAVPSPRSEEVRIRPLAVGVCGTDTHILKGEFPAHCPVVLGHEVAGIVDEVGANVRGVSEGDLVTVQPNTYCGACRYCRMGREHLCADLRSRSKSPPRRWRIPWHHSWARI